MGEVLEAERDLHFPSKIWSLFPPPPSSSSFISPPSELFPPSSLTLSCIPLNHCLDSKPKFHLIIIFVIKFLICSSGASKRLKSARTVHNGEIIMMTSMMILNDDDIDDDDDCTNANDDN